MLCIYITHQTFTIFGGFIFIDRHNIFAPARLVFADCGYTREP